ncbi:MAG: MOSC domain-containing protein [Oscillospiraceae bacterium]
MAEIIAVCISEKKGEQKHEVPEITLKIDHGIVGDAHAGNWHRQISLLAEESVDKVRASTDYPLFNGAFAENILTRGVILYELPVGTRLLLGGCLAEVTQIGKECHSGCAIREACGDCIMPREGIFVKVLSEGVVRPGDELLILK